MITTRSPCTESAWLGQPLPAALDVPCTLLLWLFNLAVSLGFNQVLGAYFTAPNLGTESTWLGQPRPAATDVPCTLLLWLFNMALSLGFSFFVDQADVAMIRSSRAQQSYSVL